MNSFRSRGSSHKRSDDYQALTAEVTDKDRELKNVIPGQHFYGANSINSLTVQRALAQVPELGGRPYADLDV